MSHSPNGYCSALTYAGKAGTGLAMTIADPVGVLNSAAV